MITRKRAPTVDGRAAARVAYVAVPNRHAGACRRRNVASTRVEEGHSLDARQGAASRAGKGQKYY